MVRIIGYNQRKTADGRTFIVLELEGELQVQKSLKGGMYACRSKCTLPFTGDESEAKELVGFSLPGSIEKIQCEQYDFTNPQTGETVSLNYRYSYKNPENTSSNENSPKVKVIEAEVN